MSKMTLTKKDIEHIARLARFKLSDDQLEEYSKDLSTIIDSVERLKEINTEEIAITTQVTGLSNVTREDKPKPSLPRELALKNAPKTLDGYFVVKRVI